MALEGNWLEIFCQFLHSACGSAASRYVARMNLPQRTEILVNRLNDPENAPDGLVLHLRTDSVEIKAERYHSVDGDGYWVYGFALRDANQLHVLRVSRASPQLCAGDDGQLGEKGSATRTVAGLASRLSTSGDFLLSLKSLFTLAIRLNSPAYVRQDWSEACRSVLPA